MAKKIQFKKHGGAEVLQYVNDKVVEPQAHEVQIEHKAIGINYIDTYIRSGLYPVANFPSGLGTEASGIVVKTGSDVTHLQEGDRVVYCQSSLGAYSEYHNVVADKVVELPKYISFEQAAASFLKGLTVYYLFYGTYPLKPGETILFHAAAGGVGRIACQWAKALGVKLIGTAGTDEKTAQALANGAWQMINYNTEDIAKRVFDITKGEKLNVVYDSVGQSTWDASLNCLKPRGLMVSFGNASGEVTGVNLGLLNQKGGVFVTRPSLGWYLPDHRTLQSAADTLFQMIGSGAVNVDVSDKQKFALKDAKLAHETLESRQSTGSSLLIP